MCVCVCLRVVRVVPSFLGLPKTRQTFGATALQRKNIRDEVRFVAEGTRARIDSWWLGGGFSEMRRPEVKANKLLVMFLRPKAAPDFDALFFVVPHFAYCALSAGTVCASLVEPAYVCNTVAWPPLRAWPGWPMACQVGLVMSASIRWACLTVSLSLSLSLISRLV